MYSRLPPTPITEDLQVQVRFPQERHLLREVVTWASRAGLSRVGLVQRVTSDSKDVGEFAAAVAAMRRPDRPELLVGVEATFADGDGSLDLPEELDGVDMIFCADHKIPTRFGLITPLQARELLESGQTNVLEILRDCLDATMAVVGRYPGLILAHPFCFLHDVGFRDDWIPETALRILSKTMLKNGSAVELNERWRCPRPAVLRIFAQEGVPIVFSSDAAHPAGTGQYEYALAQRVTALRKPTEYRTNRLPTTRIPPLRSLPRRNPAQNSAHEQSGIASL